MKNFVYVVWKRWTLLYECCMKEVCMEVQSTTPSYNRIQNFERFSQRSPFLRYPIPLLDGMGPLLSRFSLIKRTQHTTTLYIKSKANKITNRAVKLFLFPWVTLKWKLKNYFRRKERQAVSTLRTSGGPKVRVDWPSSVASASLLHKTAIKLMNERGTWVLN